MDFSKIKPALVLKRLPRNGRNKSEDLNDFIEQALHDIAALYAFTNQVVVPTFNGLGMPGTFEDIDPITNGLDGTTMMVDHDFEDTTSPYFYHNGLDRPKTVYEAFLQVVTDLNDAFVGINEVKARLGTADPDDDTVSTSRATLSEIETKVNNLNGLVIQMRNANAGYLNAGQIASGINDQSINPLSFHIVDTDVDADAGIQAIKISGVDLTTSYVYVSGVPATYDMRDTILRLKEFVEDFTGETFSYFASGNVTLSGSVNATARGHIMASGTGVVSSINPHGQDVGDFTDANGLLSKTMMIADFAIHPSGNATNNGGVSYVQRAARVTRISLTLATPTGAMGVVVWKRTDGSNAVFHSGGLLVAASPTPGFAYVDIDLPVEEHDLLFVSGIAGAGQDGRVQVFAH